MEKKPNREAVVGFAKYLKMQSFGNLLLNSKSNFATMLDKYLTSFHVINYFSQKENTLIEFIPNVFYTTTNERKEYMLISKPDDGNTSCIFDDKPSKKTAVKSIQVFVMESYEQDILHKTILEAIEKTEKSRKAAKPSSNTY